MYVAEGGTKPEHSKNEAFFKLNQPNACGDLHMIIGVFILYSQLLPLYEMDIKNWRYIFSKHPQPVKLYQNEDMELMQNL